MSDRIEVFQVTVQPNVASPGVVTPIALARPGKVVGISILVPDGHNGVTGLQLLQANQLIIPFVNGTFLVANDETLNFTINLPLDTQQWSAQAFNTGKYPHSFYIRLSINEVALPTVSFLPTPTFNFLPLIPGG